MHSTLQIKNEYYFRSIWSKLDIFFNPRILVANLRERALIMRAGALSATVASSPKSHSSSPARQNGHGLYELSPLFGARRTSSRYKMAPWFVAYIPLIVQVNCAKDPFCYGLKVLESLRSSTAETRRAPVRYECSSLPSQISSTADEDDILRSTPDRVRSSLSPNPGIERYAFFDP